MNNYPKILFLADEVPQSKGAGSIQFLRIFEHYPKDKIFVVGRTPIKGAETLNCKYLTLNFKVSNRLRLSRFRRVIPNLETLGLINYKLPYRISKELEDFKPDVVITIMQLYAFYSTAYNYAKKNKLPFYIFCHDDVEEFSGVNNLLRKRLIDRNAVIYQYAVKRFCISPQMVESWKIKYGVDGEVFYPIPDNNIKQLDNVSFELKQKNKITIGYAGSLAYGYGEGIKELVSYLEASESVLKVYNNPNNILYKELSANIQFCGFADTPAITWEKIQNECDAVILPYSNDSKFKKLYETHFPSKLVDYLSLGLPIIVVGPTYATGVLYAIDNQLLVVKDGNKAEWISQLEELKVSKKYRLDLVTNASKLKNQFLRNITRNDLVKLLGN